MTRCAAAPDCKRTPKPGYARCDDHTRQLLEPPVYRVRSRGRIEVRTPRGNWQRFAAKPVGGVELSELELRFAYGDR